MQTSADPISVNGLAKRYRGTPALNGVTFNVPPGAIYALVGSNGAGKTTLIHLLLNIFQPTSGYATVLGTPANQLQGDNFQNIGYVSENQELPESMTVGGFLAFIRTFYPRWDRSLEAELIRDFDLPTRRKLKHLSRGMKMKAALVSVLAYRPPLIILDEPFSGLDPLTRAEFLETLAARSADTTIFVSTHDLSEIETFATHVGYLERGRLLFSEDMTSLTQRFQEITITFPEAPASTQPIPPGLPNTALQPAFKGASLHFVDTQFDPATLASLAQLFPNALSITHTPMTLRTIALATAKAGRSTTAVTPNREAA